MALISYEGIGITAMAAAIPSCIINNYEYTEFFPADQVKDVVDKIGVFERRFADDDTCASDLCLAAAEKLIQDNNIDKSEIDLLVFLSQTPDYRMPDTSICLQARLGLLNSCIAFDMPMGCSGFCYILPVVYGLMQGGYIRKALILDGETLSKVVSPKDRGTAFIFGDGAVAALVERNEKFGKSWFSLNSDGTCDDLIKIKGGGYRYKSSLESLKEKVVDENGNIRNDEQVNMRGGDVFKFVIREIPRDIKKTLEFSGTDTKQIDYFVFHQANSFINSHLTRKMKLDPTKVPHSIEKYGNVSSVSIPLTIISELKGKLDGQKQILMCGFGVGMSWATAIVPFVDCKISDIVEVEHSRTVI